MGLDLNNPADFATATLSNISGLLTNLTGASNWDILQSSYQAETSTKPVYFHVFQGGTNFLDTGITVQSPIATPVNFEAAVDEVNDDISRRVSEYRFPYVDGQMTDDLGREASTYEFNAVIFGPNYKNAYLTLINELNKPTTGTLIHPVLGAITVKFKQSKVTYRSKERQAVTLHLMFVESNIDNVGFTTSSGTLKSALSLAASFISAVSTSITSVEGYAAVASTALLAVNNVIATFSTSFSSFLVALNVSFNSGTSADLPALLPANGAAGSSVFPVAGANTGIYAGSTPSQVQSLTTGPVTPAQAEAQLNTLASSAAALIVQMEALNGGQGALIYYEQTNTIRQAILAAKSALLLALQTSNALVTNYTTPRLMSIREVCFANGLSPNNSQDVLTLNPSILSANYIPQGTVLQIPSS